MRVLLLDAYNLMHRARFGFGEGEYNVVFNFFKSLRPLIEKFQPHKAYFVLEGYPKNNKELLTDYKSNRPETSEDFQRQKRIIVKLMKQLPITSIRHAHYECDDVLYSIVKNWHKDDDVTIVSSDSDFLQLYNEFSDVSIWHPVEKKIVPAPDFDYVLWKSLRGDKTDNIPGIKGVGDKTAEKLVSNPELLAERMSDPDFAEQQSRNYLLIKLEDLASQMEQAEIHKPEFIDWQAIRSEFLSMSFGSITNDKSWTKFVNTFNCLKD